MSLWLRLIAAVTGARGNNPNGFWQVGNLGTPDPTVPFLKLDAPGTILPPPSPPPPPGVVSLDVAGAVANTNTSSVPSPSITVANRSNRLLVVFVGLNNAANIAVSTLSYNGQSLTYLGVRDDTGDQQTEVWYLKQPTVGTANLAMTINQGTASVSMAWAVLYDVDQITPLSAIATGGRAGPGAVGPVAPTGLTGGYPLAACHVWSDDGVTATSDAGQTRIATDLGGNDGFYGEWGMVLDTETVVGGAQSLGFTVGNSNVYRSEVIGLVVYPAAAVTATSFPPVDYVRAAFGHLLVR